VQFRYGFVTDREGLKALDVTDLAHPKLVPGAFVKLDDARNVTVSRTFAYVSAGRNGIALVNVKQPEHPRVEQLFTADDQLNDVNDMKIGAVDASVFAYVADGRNGLRILQVISPEDSSESYGFSPRPTPKLIATYRTPGPALAISRGIDRDRAVDESGNQLAVFGRRGARPFNRAEAERLYLHDGKLYTVTDAPPGPPLPLGVTESSAKSLYDRLRALVH
jgi:hypothetical protein